MVVATSRSAVKGGSWVAAGEALKGMAAVEGEGATNEHARSTAREIPIAPAQGGPSTDQTSQQSEPHSSDGDNPFFQDAAADEESVVTSKLSISQ